MNHGLGRDGWPSDETVIKNRNIEIESLRRQLALFNSAVEHVTENGKTKRSFSVSEGWAIVHKDRLIDLECAEEQLAEKNAEIERLKANHEAACVIIADMHAAAVGEIRGPILGVIEDVANVRQQLAEKDAEFAAYKRNTNLAYKGSEQETLDKLAASQSREQQLRDALEFYVPMICKGESPAEQALVTTSDISALSAMITKAGEVMRERCVDLCDRFAAREMHPAECAGAIRAMTGVTLEDLSK